MQTIIRPAFFIGAVGVCLFLAAFFVWTMSSSFTFSALDYDKSTNLRDHQQRCIFFSATTTSAISTTDTTACQGGSIDTKGAKKVTFYFSRDAGAGLNQGLSKFEVEATPDGSTWYDFSTLLLNDVALTATTTVSMTGTTTQIAHMNLLYGNFQRIRCVVTEVSDGSHTCSATLEF